MRTIKAEQKLDLTVYKVRMAAIGRFIGYRAVAKGQR